MKRTNKILIILSHCEGSTDGPRTSAHDQRQQDHEQLHGVQVPMAKVRHHGDVPICLKRTTRPIQEKETRAMNLMRIFSRIIVTFMK